MTRLDGFVDVNGLTDDQLAKALLAGAQGSAWSEQAAIDLVVAHWRWLGRWEFRQAVDATTGHDGEACAWVDWDRINPEAPRRRASFAFWPSPARWEGSPPGGAWLTC